MQNRPPSTKEQRDQEIRDRQQYRAPDSAERQIMYTRVYRAHMKTIEAMLLLPESRERSVAITELEKTRMIMNWAVTHADLSSIRDQLLRGETTNAD